ncbi:MAG: alpha/beta fold hydrolase, partial [Rhizobiales bacterium]|nr:alpha/beta fold hydrolase [Hyphomicrobiales bacterium]
MSTYTIETRALSYAGAERLLSAAIAKATEMKVPECISIVDAGGHLLAFARMDGAFSLSMDTSLMKAKTAASYGEPTGNILAGVDIKLAIATQGQRINLPGGMPIIIEGRVVGAIGVGSGTGEEDRQVAIAALKALPGAYLEAGAGFPILMLHGVGPGTSCLANYGPVLKPLSQKFHLFCMDLIGFGNSERNRNRPFFDVDLWVRQAEAMIELMPDGPVGVIGHSMGGALALKVAARSHRVTKVMTSCGVGAPYPITEALTGFWSMPKDRAAMRKIMSRMVYAGDSVSDQMIEDRWALLNKPGYPEYFGEPFSEPQQQLIDMAVLSDNEIAGIKAQVVMLHGRDDQPCPPELTT